MNDDDDDDDISVIITKCFSLVLLQMYIYSNINKNSTGSR